MLTDPSIEADAQPSNKRRRVYLACNQCRARKSRCSGGRPCSSCEHMELSCEYRLQPTGENGADSQENIAEIKNRLATLEELIRSTHRPSLETQASGMNVASAGFQQLTGSVRSNKQQQHNASQSPSLPSLYLDDTSDAVNGTEDLDNPQIVGGMAMLVHERNVAAFFGPSSPTAFLRQINQMLCGDDAMFPKIREALHQGSASVRLAGVTPQKPYTSMAVQEPCVLPSRVEMDVLVTEFFNDTGILYPYVHEPTFMTEYAAMKASSFARPRRSWLVLLNVIFAMSLSSKPGMTMSVEKRDSDAATYYRRAVMLGGQDMYQQTSLEMAQCLLLMAYYLQSTQDAVQTWCICGLAVKAAVSLGLHAHKDLRNGSDVEKEVGTRVWCGCLILERNLGVSFGRPSAIPKSYTQLCQPQPFAKTTVIIDNVHPAKYEQESLHYLNAKLSMHSVLTDVVTLLYGENLGYEPAQAPKSFLAQVMALSESMEGWWDTVHPSIRWQQRPGQNPADDERTPLDRLKNMLKIDFLSLQLLIYRPVILHAFARRPLSDDEREHSLSHRIMATFIQKCVECCKIIICIVHDTVTSEHARRGILYAPWFSLSYSFHAALVFFAAVVSVPWALAEPREAYIPLFGKAIHTIEHVEPGNEVMQASAEYLRYLLTILKAQRCLPPRGMVHNSWSSSLLNVEPRQRTVNKENRVHFPAISQGTATAQSFPFTNDILPPLDVVTPPVNGNEFIYTQFLLPESFDFNM